MDENQIVSHRLEKTYEMMKMENSILHSDKNGDSRRGGTFLIHSTENLTNCCDFSLFF